ncbi:hypothetical protein FA95DRAFT_516314 [Auriscalpium vulgare]|uniref:Uncharacterized protein n=1 Tax=Auriscalpium vulgare TaxID=40419 RepID=A0ACB8RF92_9AGAM|nr:hypothetical protein FA95DRAFT_516314 [Auriscalpium vulgare]
MITSIDSWERQDASLESMNLMGTILAGTAYGIVFCLSLLSASYLTTPSWRTLLLAFWLFALATASIGLQIQWTLVGFVANRGYPGGPNAFIGQNVGNWLNVMLNASFVIMSWSSDVILLYRFSIIYNTFLLYVVPPLLMFIATLALGSVSLWQLAIPGRTSSSDALADWSIIYRTASLALSLVLTTLIVGRILFYRRRLRFQSPSSRSFSTLLGVAAMLIESASLETVAALIYIISVGVDSPLRNTFLPILAQIQIISPLLIVFRVARGRAWSKQTTMTMTGSLLPSHVRRPSLQINTWTSCESPVGFISPLKSPSGTLFRDLTFPPTYSSCERSGIVPPTPSFDDTPITPIPRAEHKRMTWS